MELTDLYREVILDHNKKPRNWQILMDWRILFWWMPPVLAAGHGVAIRNCGGVSHLPVLTGH